MQGDDMASGKHMPEDRINTRTRLPASRAFVVHLIDDAAAASDLLGRVEHVVSGRSIRFDDLAMLGRFFRDILNEEEHGD